VEVPGDGLFGFGVVGVVVVVDARTHCVPFHAHPTTPEQALTELKDAQASDVGVDVDGVVFGLLVGATGSVTAGRRDEPPELPQRHPDADTMITERNIAAVIVFLIATLMDDIIISLE
jgi:hypothetical protein